MVFHQILTQQDRHRKSHNQPHTTNIYTTLARQIQDKIEKFIKQIQEKERK
jgi:membrane carboxypeptidase/penicillin-binding protein PbpC